MLVDIELPWPPSVNHMYLRKYGTHQRIRTPVAQDYENDVAVLARMVKAKPIPRDKRLSMKIWLWPPDKRRRDIDNLSKSLLDSISRALDFDDCQIDELYICRCNVTKGGMAHVQIKEI